MGLQPRSFTKMLQSKQSIWTHFSEKTRNSEHEWLWQGLVPFSPASGLRWKAWRSELQHFDLPGDLLFLSWPFVTCSVCRPLGTFTGRSFPRSWTGKCCHLDFTRSHRTCDGRDHSPASTSPDLESKPWAMYHLGFAKTELDFPRSLFLRLVWVFQKLMGFPAENLWMFHLERERLGRYVIYP